MPTRAVRIHNLQYSNWSGKIFCHLNEGSVGL